jgi:hypothetical protein
MYEEDKEEWEEEDKKMKRKKNVILVSCLQVRSSIHLSRKRVNFVCQLPSVPKKWHTNFFIKLTIIFNVSDQID